MRFPDVSCGTNRIAITELCAGVPKTRSGKIMRRILRKIASKQENEIGDTSTLADPSVVDQLLESRGK